jgi:hypothetical protein
MTRRGSVSCIGQQVVKKMVIELKMLLIGRRYEGLELGHSQGRLDTWIWNLNDFGLVGWLPR